MAFGTEQDLSPDHDYCAAMRQLIATRVDALVGAIPAAMAGADIEGVHDMRVASRRLRAALDVAAPCFPDDWYPPLQNLVKKITGTLGDLRDRDVIVEALTADRDAAPPEEWPGIDRLIAKIDAERAVARAEMLEFLADLEQRDFRGDAEHRFAPVADSQSGKRSGKE
jgi:CHAD domain-containing protein